MKFIKIKIEKNKEDQRFLFPIYFYCSRAHNRGLGDGYYPAWFIAQMGRVMAWAMPVLAQAMTRVLE